MSSSMVPTVVDVLVVGAGLSGLRAALTVQAAGLSCAAIEATDRVEGKTLTVSSKLSDPGVNDVGAAWINDTSQSEMYKLLRRYGLQGEFQIVKGQDIYLHPDGAMMSPHGELLVSRNDKAVLSEAFISIRRLILNTNLKDPVSSLGGKELDQLTLQDYCIRTFQSEFITEVFNTISQSLLGLDSDEISMLSFVHYCKSGTGIDALISDGKDEAQYLRLRQGAQSFSTNMAKELITEIKQSPTSGLYTVVSKRGRLFSGKKVILTNASPLYPTIRFDPPLPESKQRLAKKNMLGYYSKIIFILIRRARDGPILFCVHTSITDDAQWSISCFMVGQRGRKWSQLSETDRRRSAWEQLCTAFRNYFHGGPCPVAPPGLLSSIDGSASRTPFGSVHFVDTETALEWKGYMERAVRSGDRGASEVITALQWESKF
ncbi:hypothetical protein BDV27DRAFT_147725 [Aspergillus caelatus]|uniref:Amine oxidase n=1 Tax=Aspergillus caelatus TaxID=61420 RepID=A0A5N6ZW95_9EURO|nr:uncharacterized protein BDV27DRAFT_147725 [Aspergillus caelatus]KAE8361543.1 hypothetical protein BDV27DRAFT_147725 [Aspergillus caelatus]